MEMKLLHTAEFAFAENDAAMTIRRSQEALELAVKALLRAIGIEYPRVHDVSDVLLEHSSKLPENLRNKIDDLAELVAELAAIRGPAFYGYEREGIPASQAFKHGYAREILNKVKYYIDIIKRTLKPIIEQ